MPWYRQNTLLFLADGHPETERVTHAEREAPRPNSVVHPQLFPLGYNIDNKGLLARMMSWSIVRDLRRMLGRQRRDALRADAS